MIHKNSTAAPAAAGIAEPCPPEPVPARDLSRGDLVATSDPAAPGEVRHVEVGDVEVLVVFAGPSSRLYRSDELVVLADPKAVAVAQEEARRRQRRLAMLDGLREFARAVAAADAPLPGYQLSLSGGMSSARDVQEVAAALGVEVKHDEANPRRWQVQWCYGEPDWPAVEVSLHYYEREPVRQ